MIFLFQNYLEKIASNVKNDMLPLQRTRVPPSRRTTKSTHHHHSTPNQTLLLCVCALLFFLLFLHTLGACLGWEFRAEFWRIPENFRFQTLFWPNFFRFWFRFRLELLFPPNIRFFHRNTPPAISAGVVIACTKRTSTGMMAVSKKKNRTVLGT